VENGHGLRGCLASAACIFFIFHNAIGGMQLICYKCFGTLNEGMEFLEFNLNLSFTLRT